MHLIYLILFLNKFTLSWVVTRDFNSGVVGSRGTGSSGFTGAGSRTTYDNLHSTSSPMSVKMSYLQGDTGFGTCRGEINYPDLHEGDEVWGSINFYFDEGFSFSCDPVFKMFRFHCMDSTKTNYNLGHLSIFGTNNGKLILSNEVDSTQWNSVGVNMERQKWINLEIYIKLSATPGDGIMRIWKDGKRVEFSKQSISYFEGIFSTLKNPTDVIYSSLIMSYWNGGPTQNQDMWVDDLIITNDISVANKIDEFGKNMIGQTPDNILYRCDGKTNTEGACGNDEGHGYCIYTNLCSCNNNWQGVSCEVPVCDNPLCNEHQYCSEIDSCLCRNGWEGDGCNTAQCVTECVTNSECTSPNLCTCISGWTGQNCDVHEGSCEPECNALKEECSELNECICKNGYEMSIENECLSVCDPICVENANCSSPNTCSCKSGWAGEKCNVRDCVDNYAGLECTKCLYGWSGDDCSTYLLKGSWTWVLPTSISVGVALFIVLIILSIGICVTIKVKKKPKALSNVEFTSDLEPMIKSEVEASQLEI